MLLALAVDRTMTHATRYAPTPSVKMTKPSERCDLDYVVRPQSQLPQPQMSGTTALAGLRG